MAHNKKYLIALTTLVACSNLTGCSTKSKVIPPTDSTISSVYHSRVQATNNNSKNLRLAVNEQLAFSDSSPEAYTLHNLKKPDYKLLPNPTLYMFVNHKLSEVDRSPIPAFMTEFKMYEKDEYALPSEYNINWGSK